MIRRLMLIAAMGSMTVAAMAAVGPTAAQEQPAKNRLTVQQAIGVLGCLRGLDGYQSVVKTRDGETVVARAYEFGDGALRWTIARNIAVLTEIENAAQASRKQIIIELSNGAGKIDPNTPEAVKFEKQWDAVLATPNALTDKLQRLKVSALKLDKNEIPASAIAACEPILDP